MSLSALLIPALCTQHTKKPTILARTPESLDDPYQHPCGFRRIPEVNYLEQGPGNYDIAPHTTVSLHLRQSAGWKVWRMTEREVLEQTLANYCVFVLKPSVKMFRSDWEDGALNIDFDILSDTQCVTDALNCFATGSEAEVVDECVGMSKSFSFCVGIIVQAPD